jgi:hypothetical protein
MPITDHITPEPNPPLTRERVIRMRELYAEGFTVARILAACQTSLGTLYDCLDGVPFGLDGEQWPAMPRRRQVLNKRRRALKGDAVSLVNRLTRTAERQVRDIELALAARELPPPERERNVRMLAQLTRALRDLQVLHKAVPPQPRAFDHGFENEDELPEDVDALRQELNRKLEAMAAGANPPSSLPPDEIA